MAEVSIHRHCEPHRRAPICIADLTLLLLHGGRERSLAEFTALLAPVAYRVQRVLPMSLPLALIEASQA